MLNLRYEAYALILAAHCVPFLVLSDATAQAGLPDFATCREMTDASARLACYDMVYDRAASAPAPAYSDREAALKAQEQELAQREAALAAERKALEQLRGQDSLDLFGVPLPGLGLGTVPDQLANADSTGAVVAERSDDGEIEAIQVPITSHSLTPDGKLVVVLSNGYVWRQVDDKRIRVPRGENFAYIRTASFGSYFLRINNEGTTVRVRRVDGLAARVK